MKKDYSWFSVYFDEGSLIRMFLLYLQKASFADLPVSKLIITIVAVIFIGYFIYIYILFQMLSLFPISRPTPTPETIYPIPLLLLL
jgi:fluoride ion exporter CrcB/FEX